MNDIKLLKLSFIIGIPFVLLLILMIALIGNQSITSDPSVVIALEDGFDIPFESRDYFSVTSEFGNRLDPLGSGEIKFHSGMDLASFCGNNVVASADGIVYEVGYSPTGLGNYVYIKHTTNAGTIFTAYGHMLDNSITVIKDEPIAKGQPIGQVGSTGASTGCHLHFMIMKNKISFQEKDLIDPKFIIYGTN